MVDAPNRSSPSAAAALVAVPLLHEVSLSCLSPFGVTVVYATPATVVAILPPRKVLLHHSPFRVAVINTTAATTVTLLPPCELLLLRHSPFGIEVVDASAAATDTNNDGNVTACWTCSSSEIQIVLPVAAGCCRRQPISVATTPSMPLPPPISLSSLSCLRQPSFLAISGTPLLPLFLVCDRHPCHL